MMSGVGSPVTNITYAECRQRAATITVDEYRIELDGPSWLVRAFPTWNNRSMFADVKREPVLTAVS